MALGSPPLSTFRSSSFPRETASDCYIVHQGRSAGPVRLPQISREEFIEAFNRTYLPLGLQIVNVLEEPQHISALDANRF